MKKRKKYIVFALGIFVAAMLGVTTAKLMSPKVGWNLETNEFDEILVKECNC